MKSLPRLATSITMILSALAGSHAIAEYRTVHFDDSDPVQWTGVGPGSGITKNTNFAGGEVAGEGGVQPVSKGKVLFADTDIGTLSLNQELIAKGRVIWRMNNGERSKRGVHLGFFDRNSHSTFVGLGFHGGNSQSRAFILHEPTNGAIDVNVQVPIGTVVTGTSKAPNDTQPYYFEMRWDPKLNELAVAIENLGIAKITLSAQQRAAFTSDLNAFGLFVPDGSGANVQILVDDLNYSTQQ